MEISIPERVEPSAARAAAIFSITGFCIAEYNILRVSPPLLPVLTSVQATTGSRRLKI